MGADRQPQTPLRIAWLGLGAMGLPMAQRLLGPELELTVFDVSTQRSKDFAQTPAQIASSVQLAVAEADIVAVMVATPEQAQKALLGDDGAASALRRGATVILLSTVGPDVARTLQRGLAALGIATLDVPVSGGVTRAANGELLIMASGKPDILESCRPVLSLLGSRIVVVGEEVGQGQSLKLVNQLLCGVHITAAAEALNLARALGLDPTGSWEAIRTGAAASFMLDDRGQRMLAEDFEPPRSALDIFVKDMGLVVGAARAARTPTPVASAAEQLFLEASQVGLGRQDDSALISFLAPSQPNDETA